MENIVSRVVDGETYTYNIKISNQDRVDNSLVNNLYAISLNNLSLELGDLLSINISYENGIQAELYYDIQKQDLESEEILQDNILNFIAEKQLNIHYFNKDYINETLAEKLSSNQSFSLLIDGGIEGIIAPESKTYVVISDNVGNIIKVIDSQGTTMNKYAYSPFGELLVEQEQVTLNIGFNTKYEDESGLTYYNNRYYSHSLGRFISQDPIFEEGGVNLYSFTANDPLNHWDILGMYTLDEGISLDGWIFGYTGVGFERGWFYRGKFVTLNLSDQDKFDAWYRTELRGAAWNKTAVSNSLSWVPNVRAPEHLCWNGESMEYSLPNGYSDDWNAPRSSSDFHPGAEYEIRTKANGAGQQATYDNEGNIITSLPGAGTADRFLPKLGSYLNHASHDIAPFNLAVDLDGGDSGTFSPNNIIVGSNVRKYYEVRPMPFISVVNMDDCPLWRELVDIKTIPLPLDGWFKKVETFKEYKHRTFVANKIITTIFNL